MHYSLEPVFIGESTVIPKDICSEPLSPRLPVPPHPPSLPPNSDQEQPSPFSLGAVMSSTVWRN